VAQYQPPLPIRVKIFAVAFFIVGCRTKLSQLWRIVMEPAKRERREFEPAKQKAPWLKVQLLWGCDAWNVTPQAAAEQVVADLFDLLAAGGTVPVRVEELDGTEHELQVMARRD
jgi:hypothetical protein